MVMYVTKYVLFVYVQAEVLRLDCKCPALKTRDPRLVIASLQQMAAEKNAAKEKDAASSSTSPPNSTVVKRRDPVLLSQAKS